MASASSVFQFSSSWHSSGSPFDKAFPSSPRFIVTCASPTKPSLPAVAYSLYVIDRPVPHTVFLFFTVKYSDNVDLLFFPASHFFPSEAPSDGVDRLWQLL